MLQTALRSLGYLRSGIDGAFGPGTACAVRALQIDLLQNVGNSSGGDGLAPLSMTAFNDDGQGGRRVAAVTGIVDTSLAECLDALLADDRFPKLPRANDPAGENASALAAVAGLRSVTAPSPFIAAMMIQESGGRHFNVRSTGDEDDFVVVGLDRNDKNERDRITSRGYGIGQYTLYHHPPRPQELAGCIANPIENVRSAYTGLRDKFDRFVTGPADRADDRTAEHPLLPLRLCRYAPADPRFMIDCRACAVAAGRLNIDRGTPAYAGSSIGYQPDQYYPSASYANVPDRATFLCDWPYAARRYNGSGNDSYHYQTRILLNLLK